MVQLICWVLTDFPSWQGYQGGKPVIDYWQFHKDLASGGWWLPLWHKEDTPVIQLSWETGERSEPENE